MVRSQEPVQPAEGSAGPGRGQANRRPSVPRRAFVAPPPSAERVLATWVREVLQARAAGPPASWLGMAFAREVDLVRRQLGPLRDRRMLVASYEREGTRLAALRRLVSDPAAPPLPLGPLEAAYAVRWLELADGGVARPSWSTLVGTEPDIPA